METVTTLFEYIITTLDAEFINILSVIELNDMEPNARLAIEAMIAMAED